MSAPPVGRVARQLYARGPRLKAGPAPPTARVGALLTCRPVPADRLLGGFGFAGLQRAHKRLIRDVGRGWRSRGQRRGSATQRSTAPLHLAGLASTSRQNLPLVRTYPGRKACARDLVAQAEFASEKPAEHLHFAGAPGYRRLRGGTNLQGRAGGRIGAVAIHAHRADAPPTLRRKSSFAPMTPAVEAEVAGCEDAR